MEWKKKSGTNGRADYPEYRVPGQKEKTKGRASGGILVEVRRVLIRRNQEVYHIKGAIGTKIRIKNDTWIVWTIYS